ncbi:MULTISPECIES: sulfurtransferase TusA family protein [Pseudovibrio]|uniref:sulfurtransferase TusA family protein n=1 Tax=Stappiaceae TaxID=2821832 RepID=UPI0023673184|nr:MULTISPECIES: sulfurtransferase TusA family protein [Pseudovibrio]MDD7909440.1 sulfurtransferase TusA family protein [Pseudovibrio exalbescens]MDX5594999.1 sulfurtransferase TusA family protein [Pseudovibrio sp. SPO723]
MDFKQLDLKGLNCPLPVMKARRALARMRAGEGLEVHATDPMAQIDIPHMCNQDGHTLHGVETQQDILVFRITRGAVEGA